MNTHHSTSERINPLTVHNTHNE